MVNVIATINLNDGVSEKFLEIFKANIPNVLAENGCIAYAPAMDVESGIPAQDNLRKDTVVILEKWESLDSLKAHLNAPHMANYREKVKDLVKNVELQILTEV